MKTTLILLVTLLFGLSLQADTDAAAKQLAQQISTQMEKIGKTRLVLIGFKNKGETPGAELSVPDLIVAHLMISYPGDYEVVDPLQADAFLESAKIKESEAILPDNLKKIKDGLGVDAIVSGQILDVESEIKVHAKIIDVEKQAIVGYAVASLGKSRAGVRKDKEKSATPVIEMYGFGFEFVSAERIDKGLKVSCLVWGLNDEKQIWVYGDYNSNQTRVVDVDGNALICTDFWVSGNKVRYNQDIKQWIPKGVKTKMEFEFTTEQEIPDNLQLFEITCREFGYDVNDHNYRVAFQDIYIKQ
ncbi:hypothetical protein [Cerasicoccus arenae]|uniref:Uncharacterized protein n=1 Tax=Cerasicoccus arenae TaxID=424488 RepID=A0A8J3DDT9_9BACT|nr:hypothetical protein [Cerasicoccus arenae]MBK1857769.1 hypothetical protein [Cerasicoccus arenae]GHC11950.1 hypothetical protein GCM10007047_31650 [Cerasicoccus arenae]